MPCQLDFLLVRTCTGEILSIVLDLSLLVLFFRTKKKKKSSSLVFFSVSSGICPVPKEKNKFKAGTVWYFD